MSDTAREPIRRLPPGPHGLPPELVERNQRERLIAAMAEACAERGYAETSVAEVAKRAGVSTASFYRQFKDRRECMLASFEELFGRLLEGIKRACPAEAEPSERARAGARAAAALLADDPPAARLLSIDVLALGAEGVRVQQAAVDRLVALLDGPGDGADGTVVSPRWATVAAMVSLVSKRIAASEELDAAELAALI